MLYNGLQEFTELKEFTPTVVNKLIERIEIHNNEKKHSHNNVKVDIYFAAIGLFDIPTEHCYEQLKNCKSKNKPYLNLYKEKGCNPVILRLHRIF